MLWLLIKLSSNFKDIAVYPLVIKSPYLNKVIVNQPYKSVLITSKTQGFKISLANYFTKKKPIVMNLSKIILTKNEDVYKTNIILSKYIKQIYDSLEIGDEIVSVKPDTLTLLLKDVISKRVPVHINLSLDFEKQYELYKPLKHEPDSITITGLKKDIDKISYLPTEYRYLKNLNKSIYLNLKIIKPKPLGRDVACNVSTSSDNIIVYVPVSKFTEGSVNIPVTVINNTRQKGIKVFPNNVKITYLVSLSDYNKVSPLMFVAAIDFPGLKTSELNKTKVQLINHPDYIRITKIDPEKVEYIIW